MPNGAFSANEVLFKDPSFTRLHIPGSICTKPAFLPRTINFGPIKTFERYTRRVESFNMIFSDRKLVRLMTLKRIFREKRSISSFNSSDGSLCPTSEFVVYIAGWLVVIGTMVIIQLLMLLILVVGGNWFSKVAVHRFLPQCDWKTYALYQNSCISIVALVVVVIVKVSVLSPKIMMVFS